MPPDPVDPDKLDAEAERLDAKPTPDRINSVDAILSDGNLAPPAKLERLMGWDRAQGSTQAGYHGRIADAADLGFSDPAPYSPDVQHAIVELYRRHRDDLPDPADAPWSAKAAKHATKQDTEN